MALGEKTTTKMKHTEKRNEPGGASHGYEEEGKASHGPVLIEKPGAAQSSKLDGSGLHVAIIASCWYEKVVHSLVDECSKELLAKGVADEDLHILKVSGAFEIPFAAARLIHCKDTSHRPDAVICIGCIVNDPTHMCDIMSQAVANGIMKLNVTSDTPVIFGVLSCKSETQAHACAEKRSCSEGQKCNHGVSWAQSALEMAHLKRCTSTKKAEQCRCVRCENRRGESSKHTPSKHEAETRESEKHESANRCRCCGCPPDKCCCRECGCAACSSKDETVGMKMPMPSHGHDFPSEHESSGSAKHKSSGHEVTRKHESSGHEDTSKHESSVGKHESSSSSRGVKHGESTECARCGSPGGTCKCGLLH